MQIFEDMLIRYFSRVLEIDKSTRRTVWEVRKQMDIAPLRSVMEWKKNVVGAAILAFSSVTVKLHRDNIQMWPWGWIDGRETVLQTPMSKLVTEEPGRQAWCSLHDTELPSDQTEHQKCRYRTEQSRIKS